MAVGVLVVSVQIVPIVNRTRRTFFHAYFQRLLQLFDIEKEQIRTVQRVEAGQLKAEIFIVVSDATSVTERIVTVYQT